MCVRDAVVYVCMSLFCVQGSVENREYVVFVFTSLLLYARVCVVPMGLVFCVK